MPASVAMSSRPVAANPDLAKASVAAVRICSRRCARGRRRTGSGLPSAMRTPLILLTPKCTCEYVYLQIHNWEVSMDDPIITVDAVTKQFRGGTRALDGLTLTIPRGIIYGLLGPNGAGKTTLIHILATLLHPDTGTVRVAGHDVVRDPAAGLTITNSEAIQGRDLHGRLPSHPDQLRLPAHPDHARLATSLRRTPAHHRHRQHP